MGRVISTVVMAAFLLAGNPVSAQSLRQLGASSASASASGGQVVQLISPTQNARGVIIRTAIFGVNGTNSFAYLLADTTTPSLSSTTYRTIYSAFNYSGSGSSYNMENSILIPSGLGIYLIGVGPNSVVNISYDLLN